MNRSFSRFLLIVGVAFYSLSSASQTSTLASLSKSPGLQRLIRGPGGCFLAEQQAAIRLRLEDGYFFVH
jgi:hypothetical protein